MKLFILWKFTFEWDECHLTIQNVPVLSFQAIEMRNSNPTPSMATSLHHSAVVTNELALASGAENTS